MTEAVNVTMEQVEAIDWGPKHEKKLRVIFLAVVLSFSTIGNSLALWTITGKLRQSSERSRRSANPQVSRLQTQSSLLFLHLVLADCLATTSCVGGQLVWELQDQAWLASNAACKLFKFSQTLGITSSTYMVVAISLDRLWAIVKPLQAHPSAGKLAGATWGLAFLPAAPSLFLFHTWYKVEVGLTHCVSKMYSDPEAYGKTFRKAYFSVIFSAVFILPFILTVVFYARILHTLCTQGPPSGRLSRHTSHRGPGSFRMNMMNGESRQTSLGLIPRARNKVLRLSVAFVVVFLLTNIPYMVNELCIVFLGSSALGRNTIAIIGITPPLNSALNPFIYLAFNSKVSACQCCSCPSGLLVRISSFWGQNSQRQCPSSCSCSQHRLDPEMLVLPSGHPDCISQEPCLHMEVREEVIRNPQEDPVTEVSDK